MKMVPNFTLESTQSLPLQGANSSIVSINDNFIEGDTFEVVLKRNSLGLGLSVTGGPEAPAPFTNLIRVKKVFPMQPAWQSGQFQEGDILISAGGQPLSGLTLRQALDVLRSGPPVTTLCVCRPKEEHLKTVEVSKKTSNTKRIRSYSFTPASIQHSFTLYDQEETEEQDDEMEVDSCVFVNYGEFSVTLDKINGSLGFSLRSDPDDTTALRHSVKALVKEPAISDGRIRPGDKLISANGKECGAMSHAELISFLRSLPETSVILKLYRDASRAQTPISTPTEAEFSRSYPNLTFLNSGSHSFSNGRSKQLRHEAKEMVKSLQASRTSLDGLSTSSGSRRLLNRPFSPAIARKNHPLTTSSSSPFVLKQFEDEQPFVETPLSPDNENGNPFQAHSDGLQIEELEDDFEDEADKFAMEIEALTEDFECIMKENEEVLEVVVPNGQNRPRHLDLFNNSKPCRPSYTFQKP